MGQIWRVFHVLCGLGWPLKTSCAVLHHRMAPFSICCHVFVLFTSSCQMGIITNAFIANVIKPSVTSIWDEADSTGAYTAPTKRLEMGLSHLQREAMHWKSFWCTGCQLRTNFSVVNARLPALVVPENSLVAQSNCDTVLSEGLCSPISQLHSYFPMQANCFLQILKCIVSGPCISLFWCRSVCGTSECERSLVTSKYALVQGLSGGIPALAWACSLPLLFMFELPTGKRQLAYLILFSYFQIVPAMSLSEGHTWAVRDRGEASRVTCGGDGARLAFYEDSGPSPCTHHTCWRPGRWLMGQSAQKHRDLAALPARTAGGTSNLYLVLREVATKNGFRCIYWRLSSSIPQNFVCLVTAKKLSLPEFIHSTKKLLNHTFLCVKWEWYFVSCYICMCVSICRFVCVCA